MGTHAYNSPQIKKGTQYTNKCDIWSLGLIFYEFLNPSHQQNFTTALKLLATLRANSSLSSETKKHEIRAIIKNLKFEENLPVNLKMLLLKMLEYDEKERIEINDIIF